MKTKFKKTMIALSIVGMAAVTAIPAATAGSCNDSHAKMDATTAGGKKDIVDTAVAADDFNTLVAAVKAAGLVEALKGEGPFTVFAPTDEAFAALPAGTLDQLLKPENKDQLTAILTYHVVGAKVPARAAKELDFGTTLNGQRIDIAYQNGELTVDGATVVAADIETRNGIIHVIDRVILPETKDILETAAAAGSFNTLAAAIEAAGLVETLQGEGPFTVFAPTDDAFAALPAGTVENLLKPENRDQLVAVLTYHVVSGRVYSDQALELGAAKTVEGQKVKIAVRNGKAKVNDSNLVALDIEATNGVIHVIDKVLLPSTDARQSSAARDLIEMAVRRGAPLYNHGQPAACAAIYEVTAEALLAMSSVSSDDKATLRTALRRMDSTHSSDRQAWIMRDALDEVADSLSEQMAMR